MTIYSYKDLIVWQKAVDLACMVYEYTNSLPEYEKYGLISQMRRASVSVPSNIAEGRSRVSRKEFARFLSISHGSLSELATQIEIVRRLNLNSKEETKKLLDLLVEVKLMLGSMVKKLNPL